MSWLGDVFKFENFNLNNNWDKLKKNPERAFIGAMDEGSTKVWNKAFDWTSPITGINRHYEPMTDYWGGAPKDSYTKAEAQGINTGPGRSMHNVAKTIASIYAGGYGAGQLGAGAGAGGSEGAMTTGEMMGSGGQFTPTAGSSFTVDPSASYTTAYPNYGASAAPYAGDSQYAAQDVMQQARDTSAPTGSSQAWDTGSQSGNGLSALQKQMMAKSLMNMGGRQYQQQPPLEIVKSQSPFVQVEDPTNVQNQPQNENAFNLAQLLRTYDGGY